MENKFYDIIVIGAGSGGLNIASFMNKAGFKVLLADKSDSNIGGDCLNFGCIPSKALIHLAKITMNAKESENLGLKINGKIDIEKIRKYILEKKEIIRKHENASYFRKRGIDVVLGEAEFSGKNSIKIGDKIYFGKKIVIATGSKPKKLKVKGIEKVKNIYSNENIFEINSLPKKLVVIGAGPIGIELGQAFSRFGSKVTIVNNKSGILEKEDPEISKILIEELENEGLEIISSCNPLEFKKDELILSRSGKRKILKFDAILVSIGRDLNIPRGLERAGISLSKNKQFIKSNKYLQTTNKSVYLCGDVLGKHAFTHAAELHASIILNNFFSPMKKKLSSDKFSWVTFTDPEIATFGLNEKELKKRKIKYRKIIENYQDTDRGITDNSNGKLILYISKNRIFGGSLIAPNAGEIVQELILANKINLDVNEIFSKIYPYPTASRINKKAITQLFENKLNPLNKRILKIFYH